MDYQNKTLLLTYLRVHFGCSNQQMAFATSRFMDPGSVQPYNVGLGIFVAQAQLLFNPQPGMAGTLTTSIHI